MIAKRIYSFPAKALFLSLTCLTLSLASALAQIYANPNTQAGTIRFSNSNPAILSLP